MLIDRGPPKDLEAQTCRTQPVSVDHGFDTVKISGVSFQVCLVFLASRFQAQTESKAKVRQAGHSSDSRANAPKKILQVESTERGHQFGQRGACRAVRNTI